MANGTNFKGANTRYRPPEGVSEEQCHTLQVFKNGTCIVACWEISDGEMIELIRTRKIFTSVWSGNTLYPMAVGAESLMRPLVADFGAVWAIEDEPSGPREPRMEGRDQLVKILEYYANSPFDDVSNETVRVKATLLATAAAHIRELQSALELSYRELKMHDADYHHKTNVNINNQIVDVLGRTNQSGSTS